ncbi:MAG TPA: signal peptide peptidase SppA [Stellaceae bacterium]|jgi:protease-4|nr:signal peptide peptidase SppA [Stellaceae bacterium]
MRRLLVGFFAAIGVLAVLFGIALAVAVIRLQPGKPSLPNNIILSADLNRGLAEGRGEEGWRRLVLGGKPSLRDFLDALQAAGADPRVKGILARVGDDETGLAEAQQVRDAIAAFRAKGKFAVAFAESFGEFGAGTRPYYLATAFDQIWLQPMGSLGLTGLYAESTFFKGALDLVGIAPEFDHRGQFKTAANVLTETRMTPPAREEVEDLLASISGQVVGGIAQARKLSPDAIRGAIDRAPLLPDEALQAKLVDRLGYRDDAIAAAHKRAGSDAEIVDLATYLDGAGRPNRKGERIALIYGSGLIVRGGGAANALAGSDEMAANDMTRAFRDAVRDPKVRAILFRIDSPGGSVTASETIWHDVVFARERGKPVIVSMGNVAGSGGYYVAAPADKIVAEPATLTGSIGVLAGKLVVAKLLKKIGVSTDAAQFGANAAMFSATSDFSPLARGRLQAFLDATYQGFKDHVAAGRHLTPDAVEAIAQGRVWSGEEAKANGLVDALGGYEVALRLAKEVANIPADAPVELTVFPRREGLAAYLYDRLTGKERDDNDIGVTALGRAIEAAQPMVERIEALLDNTAMVIMPSFGQPR